MKVSEIKVNNPQLEFPIHIDSYEKAQRVGKTLINLGYSSINKGNPIKLNIWPWSLSKPLSGIWKNSTKNKPYKEFYIELIDADDKVIMHKWAENINELSATNGGAAGEYNTPKAARPKKKQDTKSPTGFESSPNPNMYTKTMKFKIVDPNNRLNSKDLWNPKKGQPKFDNFPQSKKVYTEIKIGNPKLNGWTKDEYWNLENYHDRTGLLPQNISKEDFEWLRNKFGYVDEYEGDNEYDMGSWVNEVRYSKFKKETSRRTPQEQLHKAIKEIQMKMDEVNKLVDFTSKMKQELREDDSGVKYLKRTKNSIGKIQEKIQHISNKIKNILE